MLTLSNHTERIGVLDAREGAHWQEIAEGLGRLRSRLTGVEGTVKDQADLLALLDGLDEDVRTLQSSVASLLPPPGKPGRYSPGPTIRWWDIPDEASDPDTLTRGEALDRLRAWVEQIYRPGYGHLGAKLGKCWAQHPLCLYTLDWLSELWSVLYLQPDRRIGELSAQAEFGNRTLPEAAELMAVETSECEHTPKTAGARPVAARPYPVPNGVPR
jgi:hypothetical protein